MRDMVCAAIGSTSAVRLSHLVVGHDHVRALADQRLDGGAADAAAGASHDRRSYSQETRHRSAPVFLPALAISAAV